ncbi:MAG TPA: F0F1 ATP synthase subunit delta, partial [Ottowia sp.]|nr:F0F1 ATP synthase subunit delta [Ottowia sp.]
MAELATIARPYAEALFKVSRADLAATQSWMDGLAAVAGSEQLLQFAANPKAGADQVYQLVSGVLGQSLPARGANFLRAVIDN